MILAPTSPLKPQEIVDALNRHIVGQQDAKKAVAIALRNRWRRLQVLPPLRDEITPKNILMIGPTGVGKTEISRRLAKLSGAPFIKIEATKFTEVGYVGRDVEQIIRDLVDIAIKQTKEFQRESVTEKAENSTEFRILTALVGKGASEDTYKRFRGMYRTGELDPREITIEVEDKKNSGLPTIDIPGMPGAQMGMLNLGDILGKSLGSSYKDKKMTVKRARELIMDEECDKLLDNEGIVQHALHQVEENGIVFLDEIDKICQRSEGGGRGEVSREGVQRDLLPLIEGTVVSTKHGMVKTDHVLFIASGAFHLSKPSDLLPELQGRLPIRVELCPLTEEDFIHILDQTESSLIKQYKALMATEGICLNFTDDAIKSLARIAVDVNQNVENIGARRLQTVMEKLLEDLSYTATQLKGQTIDIDEDYVEKQVGTLSKRADLSRYIL